MNKNIILSVIGPDEPGIVSSISEVVKNHSGNINKSRMVRLGDFFTIMVLISINESNIHSLNSELKKYLNYQIIIHELKNDSINNINENIIILFIKHPFHNAN